MRERERRGARRQTSADVLEGQDSASLGAQGGGVQHLIGLIDDHDLHVPGVEVAVLQRANH